jgi:hypothetical protein
MSSNSRLFATSFRKLVMKRTLFSISSGPTFHLTKRSPSPCPYFFIKLCCHLHYSRFLSFVDKMRVCQNDSIIDKILPYICNKHVKRKGQIKLCFSLDQFSEYMFYIISLSVNVVVFKFWLQ